jgi:hypothetical protein
MLLVTLGCGPDPSSDAEKAMARQFVADNQGGFLTRISCEKNEAALGPVGWASLDERGKRGATVTLAIYCEAEAGRKAISIIDAQSGRVLAEYDGLSYRVK